VAIRTMSDAISFTVPGRPGRFGANVHFWTISRRCHRRIVSGVTMVATCLRTRRPSRWPFTARRRRWSSVNRRRRPLQLLFEDVVFLDQVLDDLLLMPVDPSSEGHEQQPHGGEIGSHRLIVLCHIPAL
jgi:hypothetical protein